MLEEVNSLFVKLYFITIMKLRSQLICSIAVLAHITTTASLRYTEKSCIDLSPRTYDEYGNAQKLYTSSSESKLKLSSSKRRRSSNYGGIPFKLTATGRRYRRDSDVIVEIDGSAFDALMLQARHIPSNGDEYGIVSTVVGASGVVVAGQFRYLRFPFKYLTCFDSPAATVIDDMKPIKLRNLSFVWRSPDEDVGDIRFIASVLRGVHFWVILSNILTFNPFPTSSYSCGSTLACFRVCPFEQQTCSPRDALLVFTYHVDSDRREIQFTLGGRLQQRNNSYIAVAFGEEYESMRQADMMACWLDHEKAKIEHLLVENLLLPPYLHAERPIEVDDYDFHVDEHGHSMLWCRFHKSINPLSSPFFNISKSYYHFHFSGTIGNNFQRFILPKYQNEIYTSANKQNISHSLNEIVSKSSKVRITCILIMISIILFLNDDLG